MIAPLSLFAYAAKYSLSRPVRKSTATQHRTAVRCFGNYLGRTPTLADLDDDTLNGWIVWMLGDAKLAHESVRSRRKAVLTLWRAAEEDRLHSLLPGKIRRVVSPQKLPEAWSREQIKRILEVATTKTTTMRCHIGIRWSEFWFAFISTGYFTGLRLSDLLDLKIGQIADDGTFYVTQSKTNGVVFCRVPLDVLAGINRMNRVKRKRIFGDLVSKQTLWREFRFLLAEAKVPGSIKWLRRSGATWVEATTPGSATAFLGHRSPGIAAKHYVDPRYVQAQKPMPPPLT